MRISGNAAVSRLTATPVPGSTVIRVDATGASEASAVALANGASSGLRQYVVKLNQNAQANGMLRDFQQSQRAVNAAQRRLDRALKGGNTGSVQKAQLALQTAQLRASTAEGRYKYESGSEPPPNLVQLLAPASSATSDFAARLQELLLIGLVAGAVIGLALALLRANIGLIRRRT